MLSYTARYLQLWIASLPGTNAPASRGHELHSLAGREGFHGLQQHLSQPPALSASSIICCRCLRQLDFVRSTFSLCSTLKLMNPLQFAAGSLGGIARAGKPRHG